MKVVISKIALVVFVFFTHCATPQNKNDMNNLIVKLEASFSGQIGYGEVFKCNVLEGTQGELESDSITITVLNIDKNYSGILSKNQTPKILEVSFEKQDENVQYSLMPITGMVDSKKTSWVIQEIKESK